PCTSWQTSRSRPAKWSRRSRTRSQSVATSGEPQLWRSTPMVTVRTSSLCWRTMPSVARTSSVRYNDVAPLGVSGRADADGAGLVGGEEDVLVLEEDLQAQLGAGLLQLGPQLGRPQVGREEDLHHQAEAGAVGARVQIHDV